MIRIKMHISKAKLPFNPPGEVKCKLQNGVSTLTTSFEEIKMEEDEPFDEFYAKLKDIVNSAFKLGDTISESKIVRKVLRSLPERFHAKITVIEESKDIDKIPLTELVGNLQNYELGLTRIRKSSKGKNMAVKAKSSDTNKSSDDEDSKMKSVRF